MKLEIFKAVDGEMQADFMVRPETHDRNIVQEIWDKKFYSYEIKPGDVVVDIGAHIGSFSVWALHHGANIVAFEPDEVNFNLLSHNIDEAKKTCAGNADVHNTAVRSSRGVFFMNRGAEGQPNTGGYKVIDEVEAVKTTEPLQRIDNITKTDLIFKHTPIIDFLKLDCEGSEFDILENLTDEQWGQINSIMMEWHFDKMRADRLVELIKSKGFAITDYSTNPDAPEPLGRIMAKK